jgi:hypothetical protein
MNLSQLLKGREFVSFASADLKGQPNNAPKMLLKFEKPYIYLIEYSFGRTHDNLKSNPQACLSFMDLDNIEGYRIYGTVELIEKGPDFKKLAKELEKRQVQLSTTRVIDAVRTGSSPGCAGLIYLRISPTNPPTSSRSSSSRSPRSPRSALAATSFARKTIARSNKKGRPSARRALRREGAGECGRKSLALPPFFSLRRPFPIASR